MDYMELLAGISRMDGKDVSLCRCRLEDAPEIFTYCQDPEVTKYLTWEPHKTLEDTVRVVEEFYLPNPGYFNIVHRQSGRVIGGTDLRVNPDHHRASFGYFLSRDYWGRGYMTQVLELLLEIAFDKLGLHRVEGMHYQDNKASGRVMEKCGMQLEGICPDKDFVKGVYHTDCLYGILEHQWRANRGG